ncbi:alanine/ornithine racemase family PLP-dependent enzyme [Thalassobacillus sp. CUG 92003]|uniref:alanine/ornithine racemase family PLP-dependent enzyme n=1 Tax=Thalassobacillus sp. CUG 92003 TaxID=2736641 RepID=UPI0021042832|nr:alanine/ornithine racemase family PLP-dependent enzyme [Thalassobacillus sp. CUG 92003]
MNKVRLPRVDINLDKIAHNVEQLVALYGRKGIEVMGVTKTVCGDPTIAQVFVDKGIRTLSDSRIANLKTMREAGIEARFVLLRTPAMSELDVVVKYADISLNTELAVIQKLSTEALAQNTMHEIILMVEMGDLREGIMPEDVKSTVRKILQMRGVRIVGIGANFACFGGVKPSPAKMNALSQLADDLDTTFGLDLEFVSGGNSANYQWFSTCDDVGRINNLRLGESIYLGRETLEREAIPGLFTDAFTFVSEVIETKVKPSAPYGERGQDAFGNTTTFTDKGLMKRAILGSGLQDVIVTGLTPKSDIEILGASSDHTLIDTKNAPLSPGDEVAFDLDYGALLSVMTSPYVAKKYVIATQELNTVS